VRSQGKFTVLLSSAGRRVVLLRLFRQTLKDLGLEGCLLVADTSRSSPTFHLADRSFRVPPCLDGSFPEAVLEICRREAIDLIVPTIDTELPVYAAHRESFAREGVLVAVSSQETINTCRDKVRTHSWLRQHGFPTPEQWHGAEIPPNLAYPVIIKPRHGSASVGVCRAQDRDEMAFYLRRIKDPIVEVELRGTEYTVNFYVSRTGRVLSAVPHQRMEVRAGEVSKGMTVKHGGLMETARRLGEALPQAFGAMNFQCFLIDGAAQITEINGRFGGGYPLAHQAGVNFPRWLIEEALGQEVSGQEDFDQWEEGCTMLRYDDAVYLKKGELEPPNEQVRQTSRL
jgi:carbamoyl-phosphate synthase large subunit